MHGSESKLHSRLLDTLRSDCDRLRWEGQPLRAQLLHRATNANAEGVLGTPTPREPPIAVQGAGHRVFSQIHDENGRPIFRDDPIVDVSGKPITNSAGQAFDVVMPAFRTVTFVGSRDEYARLSEIAERAGRIALNLSHLESLKFSSRWIFSKPSDLWWAIVFEMAWDGRHPFLVSEKRLWLPSAEPSTFIPYDLQALRFLCDSGIGSTSSVPTNWTKRLPDAWVSELDNIITASHDCLESLMDELANTKESSEVNQVANSPVTEAMHSQVKIRRRFAVALTFPGEHRHFVEAVARALSSALGEQRVFYDRFHEPELSRPNLDIVLQRFYEEDSDLVVVFVCGEYVHKEWCGLEWRAVRELMKASHRADEDVMFLRLDQKPLPGLLSIDGFLDVTKRSARDVADAILRRWSAAR